MKRNKRPLTLMDFLPSWCKPKPKEKDPEMIEARLKAALNSLAKQNQPDNGQ